jgi:WD40 repeat protein/energy-coupling factor transporter ATP-binding protein EcfA2
MPPTVNKLFISYVDEDRAWVCGYLLPLLQEFRDGILTHADFPPGSSKIEEIEKAIRDSQYTFIIFSPAYLQNVWGSLMEQMTSYFSTRNGQNGLIPILAKACELPLRISFRVILDFTSETQWPDESKRLLDFLQSTHPDQQDFLPCPYPGMVPFSAEKAEAFFGRDKEIGQVVQAIRQLKFLCILGASGSGKSSLLYAGVLPRLETSSFFGKGYWLVKDMRPGLSPLQRLLQILGSDDPEMDMDSAVGKLLQDNPPAQRLLLLIDQFEEIFGQVPKDEAEIFIRIVQKLRRQDNCCVLITMRAAFYQDLMASALWPVEVAERIELIPPRDAELAAAIERPAARLGVYLEQGLMDMILHDAAKEPGVLPLIQEVMILLWDKRAGRLMTVSSYTSLGKSGLAVAIAMKADATYLSLPPERQRIAKRIFIRLIQFGEGRPDTRRQQPTTALQSLEDDRSDFSYCLLYLVNNRLLTLSGEESDTIVNVDIAHESLIDGWPLLHTWVTERREAEQARRRLQQKAEEWVRLGQGNGGLLDTVELAEAETWLKGSDAKELGFGKEINGLLQKSRTSLAAGEQEKKEARERELANAKKWALRLAFALCIAVVAIIAAYIELQLASSRQLAAQALSPRAHLDDAIKLSIDGIHKSVNKETKSGLLSVLQQSSQMLKFLHGFTNFAWSVKMSPDKKTFATGHSDGTILFWDLQTCRPLTEPLKQHLKSINSIEYSRDGKLLISAGADGKVICWDALQHKMLKTLYDDAKNNVAGISLSPDNQTLAIAGTTTYIYLINIGTGEQIASPLKAHTNTINALAFSPDGKILASGSDDETVILWDMTTRKPIGKPLNQHLGGVFCLAFSPDGTMLASGSGGDVSENLILWDVINHNSIANPLVGHTGGVFDLLFSPGGDTLYSSSTDNKIIAWNMNDLGKLRILTGHKDQINAITLSADGTQLISAAWDNCIIVWDIVQGNFLGKKVMTPPFLVKALKFLPDKKTILSVDADGNLVWKKDTATVGTWCTQTLYPNTFPKALAVSQPLHVAAIGNGDGSVSFWDLQTRRQLGRRVQGNKEKIVALAINKEGTILASGATDGFVVLWDIQQRRVLGPPLKAHRGEINDLCFSPDGKAVAAAYDGSAVIRWDVATQKRLGDALYGDGIVLSVVYSPDGRYLVYGNGYIEGSKIMVYDLQLNQSTQLEIPDDGSQIEKLGFSHDGKILAAGTRDGTVALWSMTPRPVFRFASLIDGARDILSLSFSPNGQELSIGTSMKGIYLWQLSQPAPRQFFKTSSRALDLTFVSDSLLAGVISDSAVTILNIKNQKEEYKLQDSADQYMEYIAISADAQTVVMGSNNKIITSWKNGRPTSFTVGRKVVGISLFSPNNWVAIAEEDSSLHYMDLATGKEVQTATHFPDNITCVNSNNKGNVLAVGLSNGSIDLFDARTFRVIGHSLEGHAKNINCLVFSPDDKYLASGSYDRMIFVWDISTQKALSRPFMAHEGQVLALAFSSDGRMLASGGADKYINLWDIPSRSQYGSAFKTASSIRSLVFAPDGRSLFSSGDDKAVMQWTLDAKDWLKYAEKVSNF